MKRWTFRKLLNGEAALDPNVLIFPGRPSAVMNELIRHIYDLENQIETMLPAELEPCEVCGRGGVQVVGPNDGLYFVMCAKCGAQSAAYPSPLAAVRAWNDFQRR